MSQPRNTSGFTDIQISPLSGTFDLRSTPGTMAFGDFRLVLNASMNELGKRCRRPQWRKYGTGSPYGFNNQDLHDRLNGLQYHCDDGRSDTCACPTVPDCLRLIDYEYGVVLENCVDGVDSLAEEWDGSISRTGDCVWGFSYGEKAFGGKTAAIILSLKSCVDGINVYRLEINVQLADGTGLIVWAGESIGTPVGTYSWTAGCDETPTLSMENCDSCTAPVITASPPTGTTITEGSYISLTATDGALIFFTADGSEPDNTSELYTGPFQLNSSATVKARAYTGTCSSTAQSYVYTVIGADQFLFEFTCDTEDQAGSFYVFSPNGVDDYNWRLTLNMPEINVVRIEIYETNSDGVWVTGQSWASVLTLYPPELGGDPFNSYPTVIFEDGSKLANDYTAPDAFLVSGLAEEEHIWMIYGQPFRPLVGYFKMVFVYEELGEEKTIYSIIPHECSYYYDDGDEECVDTEFVQSQSLGLQNSNFTFTCGMKIVIGAEDVEITHLGRWVVTGNNQEHEIVIRNDAFDVLGSVTVDCNGATPEQFLYGELAEPITLTAGATYYILSDESSTGDEIYGDEIGGFSIVDTTDVATVVSAVDYDSEPNEFVGDGWCYGPLSFKYCG